MKSCFCKDGSLVCSRSGAGLGLRHRSLYFCRKSPSRMAYRRCHNRATFEKCRHHAAAVSRRARLIRSRSRGECIATHRVAAPLHVQPEIRAVAKHASKDERGRGGHGPAVVAQLIHVLALHADRFCQRLCQAHRLHELFNQNFANALPVFVSSSAWLTSPTTMVVQIEACRFHVSILPIQALMDYGASLVFIEV